MFFIRQNATHKVVIGPVVAVGDGFTPVTNLALGTADEAEAILHDNGTVVDISAYTFAAITTADGYYHLTLQSGISGTIGHMTVVINDDSLCLPVKADFTVVEEAIYDLLYASGATGQVTLAAVTHTGATIPTVTTLTGHTAQTADHTAAIADIPTVAEFNARTLAAADYFDPAADTVANVMTVATTTTNTDMRGTDSALTDKDGFTLSVAGVLAIWHQALSAVVTAGSVGKLLKDEITAARMAVLTDWIDAGRLDAILDIIAADVVNIDGAAMRGTDGANTTTPPTAAAIADQVWEEAIADHSGTSGSTAESLDGATAPTAAAVADAVWDEVRTGHTTAGTFGLYLDAQISGVGGAVGSGAISFTYTVYEPDGTTPLPGVDIWVTSDLAGASVIAGVLVSDANGEVTFMLDAGTVYVWRQLAGWNFTNPDTETVA